MPHTLHQLLPRFVSKTHDAFNTHNVVALQVKQAFQKCFEDAFVYALMHAQCGGVNVRMAHMAGPVMLMWLPARTANFAKLPVNNAMAIADYLVGHAAKERAQHDRTRVNAPS